MEEKQAVILLKKGDMDGLQYLVEKYQVKAVQAAYLILGDRNLAEDIVQSSFILIAEKIYQFDIERPFGPWFYRIVVNASIKTAMREQKLVSIHSADEEKRIPHGLADPVRTLEEIVENTETRREVWRAICDLTLKQRTVLVLRYYLGMTNKEISLALGEPLSSVRWAIHAGYEKLRHLLSPIDPSRTGQEDISHEKSEEDWK
jgi:RNA polymerase sigma-70 factor (ECF subfamily)